MFPLQIPYYAHLSYNLHIILCSNGGPGAHRNRGRVIHATAYAEEGGGSAVV